MTTDSTRSSLEQWAKWGKEKGRTGGVVFGFQFPLWPGAAGILLWVSHHGSEAMGPESESFVKLLGVGGEEVEAAALQAWMGQDHLHHPFSQAMPAMGVADDHVAEVAHGRVIC